MSFFRLGVSTLFSCALLSGCMPPNMVNGGLVNPWGSPYPTPAPTPAPVSYVDVYKYQGSRQCEGGGVPLAEMQRQLQALRIPVVNSACGMDGRMYPAVCGSADGRINILSIPSDAVQLAMGQGFFLLSDLPEAQRVNCSANAVNNTTSSSVTTYPYTPYTGGNNTSYYSYQ